MAEKVGMRATQTPFVVMTISLAAIVCLAGCQQSFVPRPMLSAGQDGWNYCPRFSDEFDGTRLDTSKWHDHNPAWAGRAPAWFSPDNVRVEGGMLRLVAKAENRPGLPPEYHTLTTAAVKSRERIQYGFFETRCRPARCTAVSAFWLYDSTPSWWGEIDVFEIAAGVPWATRNYNTNFHLFHKPGYQGTIEKHIERAVTWNAPYVLADEFHVYGMEWAATDIKWYVDGRLIRREDNEHIHEPMFININLETQPWYGVPAPESLPAVYEVDYVRAWGRT